MIGMLGMLLFDILSLIVGLIGTMLIITSHHSLWYLLLVFAFAIAGTIVRNHIRPTKQSGAIGANHNGHFAD